MTEIENFVRLIERAAKTMKNTAQLTRVWLHDLQRLLPRIALMDHCVEPQLHGEVELLLKQTRLFRFVSAVANLGFDFFIGLSAQRGHHLDLLFFRHFFAWQTMIIEARLADGHHARVLCQFAQRRKNIVLRLFDVSRMNANCCVNGLIFFR